MPPELLTFLQNIPNHEQWNHLPTVNVFSTASRFRFGNIRGGRATVTINA